MDTAETSCNENITKGETLGELQLKVLVVGEYGVGKTAVIRRYTQGQFSLNYKVTIGVDFAVKTFDWDSNTKLNIQLWDIAGHERFGSLTRVYYKYAVAAVVVFDLSRPESLQSVIKWVVDVREKAVFIEGRKIPVILLANKCDVEGISINTGVISKFCDQHDIDKWFLTSAKEDININAAMDWIVMRVLELRTAPPAPLPSIKLTSEQQIVNETATSCCR